MGFKLWLMKEWTGDSGNVGELGFPKVGDRRYHAAGIRSKWHSIGMKKTMKKQKSK